MRPRFLDTPRRWTTAPRHGLTPVEYANPVTGFKRWSVLGALCALIRRITT